MQIAQQFALAINCPERCGECSACRKIIRAVHPDVRWIAKTAQRIGIDQIRELKEDALYPPMESAKKIYIIDGVEDMSIEAANSLLRILEAPPPYLIFLLLACGLGEIPLTIISRCQILHLKSASREQMKEELSSLKLAEEEINYLLAVTKGMDYLLARLKLLAGYRPLAEKEKVIEKLRGLNDQELIGFFSEEDSLIGEREAVLELLKRLLSLSAFELLEIAAALSKLERAKLEIFFHEALCWYRDMLMIKYDNMSILNLDRVEELQQYGSNFPLKELVELIKELELAEKELRGNANIQLLLESLLFKMRCLR